MYPICLIMYPKGKLDFSYFQTIHNKKEEEEFVKKECVNSLQEYFNNCIENGIGCLEIIERDSKKWSEMYSDKIEEIDDWEIIFNPNKESISIPDEYNKILVANIPNDYRLLSEYKTIQKNYQDTIDNIYDQMKNNYDCSILCDKSSPENIKHVREFILQHFNYKSELERKYPNLRECYMYVYKC